MADKGKQPERTPGGRRVLWSVGRIVLLSYLGMIGLMFGCQRSYIYFPSRASETVLERRAAQSGLEAWRDSEGTLHGWRSMRPAPQAERVLVFHGNAGSAVDRDYYAWAFENRPGNRDWEVFLLEYPGYGARPGSPSEPALRDAARRALDLLFREDPRPVLLLGESLGGGVACLLAGEAPERVAGLLLVTPFLSLADVAAVHYPWLPVRLLLRDRFDASQALRAYNGPMAVLLAGRDEVAPVRLGQALFDQYQGPKQQFLQETATHNTLDLAADAAWWDEAVAFLMQHPPRPAGNRDQ